MRCAGSRGMIQKTTEHVADKPTYYFKMNETMLYQCKSIHHTKPSWIGVPLFIQVGLASRRMQSMRIQAFAARRYPPG